MSNILDVAKYICSFYKETSNCPIDELKLHKLLYLCQREKLAIANEEMFATDFEGWKHGPVSRIVRKCFKKGMKVEIKSLTSEDKYIIENVLDQYGAMDSWDLAEITHKETSWINSRKGLREDENGDVPLALEDIRVDASNTRPFDSKWGMYYDEFDDLEVAQ